MQRLDIQQSGIGETFGDSQTYILCIHGWQLPDASRAINTAENVVSHHNLYSKYLSQSKTQNAITEIL
jgi:hypothetical protein